MAHLQGLSHLESEHQAILQSRRLARYYFGKALNPSQLKLFYTLNTLSEIEKYIRPLA